MSNKPTITLSEPYPYLTPGNYVARCTAADFAWAIRWKKWIAKLDLEPQNYNGPRYPGKLCKFLGLGRNPGKPHAGPRTDFWQLWVEANGDQPLSLETSDLEIFVGKLYDISVETVTKDRNGVSRLPVHHYSVVRSIHRHKGEL